MDFPEPMIGEPSIPLLVARLTHDARDVARAEIALAKAKAGAAAGRYKRAAMLFAVAGVLALASLVTLLVGLVLTLATLIGPGLATLAVVGVVMVVALVVALAGRSRLNARSIS